MSTAPLPDKSVRLSTAGFKKLYESVRGNPAAAKAIADEIEADPRCALERLFKLNKPQQAAIANTSDEELMRRARTLLSELRAANPKSLRFRPHGARGADVAPRRGSNILSCTCIIDA